MRMSGSVLATGYPENAYLERRIHVTPEQLASARAAHWREDANPLLTLDDAKAWLGQMQLCLYLPRKTHILAPAPSFVGAVAGSSSATPSPEAIQLAHDLLVRLVAEGTIVPLNLFGTPGEQPDFLVLTTALPHLAAMQPDRNWKKAPARTGPGKVSPLAIEVWKLLNREGALTADEIRDQLGHELTEAATMRGLSELWQNLRVAPLPQPDGAPAHWELLSVMHKKEMAAGGTLSQSTALSLLVSYYVQSVLAATAEDIEAFLSPIASRTRLRDVIRGLSATRQLRTLSMDAQTFLFIEGTLPDMPEIASAEPAAEKPAFMGRSAYRQRMLNKVTDDETPKEDTSPRTYNDRRGDDKPRRAFPDRGDKSGPVAPPRRAPGRPPADGPRPARFAAGSRPSFGDRARGAASSRFRGEKSTGAAPRPFRPRPDGESPNGGRPEKSREGRPFRPREGTGRPPFRERAAGPGSRPFRPRADGDRPRPGADRSRSSSDRPFRAKSSEGRPFAPRPSSGRDAASRPPFRGKPADGGTRPYRPRPARPEGGGDSRPFTPREGARPFRGKPAAAGERPYRPRPEGERPFRPKTGQAKTGEWKTGEARTFKPRPSGDRQRPFSGRPSSARPSSGRPSSGRPASARPASSGRSQGPAGGRRPAGSGPAKSSFSKPGFSKPGSGRPGFGSRPGTPGRNPGGTGRPPSRPGTGPRFEGKKFSANRPASGRPSANKPASGPGGFRPPTRKPRKPESESE